jgi:hypothetical protein
MDARLLAEVVVGLWRARAKMTDASTGEPRAEFRHAYLHVQAVWDVLAGAGVEAQGHDGTAYDPGLSITAVAFRPVPGLAREEIVETLRPTVYLSGRMLAQGEVVVGTPAPRRESGQDGGRQLWPG